MLATLEDPVHPQGQVSQNQLHELFAESEDNVLIKSGLDLCTFDNGASILISRYKQAGLVQV